MPSILYFGSGVKPWAKRLRGRGGILGEEAASHPPHQLQGLGERCKLTQWGPGRRPAAKRFLTFWRRHMASPGLVGGQVREVEAWPLATTLNPPIGLQAFPLSSLEVLLSVE